MARHVWSVLCSKGVVDEQSNQISLLDVLEHVSFEVASLPKQEGDNIRLVHFPCQLISLWTRSDHDVPELAECRLYLLKWDGSESKRVPMEVDLRKSPRFRSTFRMEGVPLGTGLLWFVVECRSSADDTWIEAARVPLEVVSRVAQKTKKPTSKKPSVKA